MFQGHRYAQGISDKKELAGGPVYPPSQQQAAGSFLGSRALFASYCPKQRPLTTLNPAKPPAFPRWKNKSTKHQQKKTIGRLMAEHVFLVQKTPLPCSKCRLVGCSEWRKVILELKKLELKKSFFGSCEWREVVLSSTTVFGALNGGK